MIQFILSPVSILKARVALLPPEILLEISAKSFLFNILCLPYEWESHSILP